MNNLIKGKFPDNLPGDFQGGRDGGGAGDGPEDPMLEKRVEVLEADMKDVKSSLSRLEIGFARMEEKLSHLATKEDVARVESKLAGEISGLNGRVSNLPNTWQIIGILAGLLFGVASVVFATNTFISQKITAPVTQAAPTK